MIEKDSKGQDTEPQITANLSRFDIQHNPAWLCFPCQCHDSSITGQEQACILSNLAVSGLVYQEVSLIPIILTLKTHYPAPFPTIPTSLV